MKEQSVRVLRSGFGIRSHVASMGINKHTSGQQSEKELVLFLSVYGFALFLLQPHLSLWLDEILDLSSLKTNNLSIMLSGIAHNAGAVPLGYLFQAASIHLLSLAAFAGRLPSMCFSVAACLGMYVLGKLVSLRRPVVPALVFALTPLQLRYALEARPYSQALALSVWTTIVFLYLLKRPCKKFAFLYGVGVLLDLYTVPYSLFVAVSHVVWVIVDKSLLSRKRILSLSCSAVIIAVALFVPWYLFARGSWTTSILTTHLQTGLSFKTPLMVLRELIGVGYVGTALIISLGIAARKILKRDIGLWISYASLPAILSLVGDFVAHYFVAIRQMIFVLVPLVIMASCGLTSVSQKSRRLALSMGTVLIAILLYGDLKLFLKPREDWQAASATLRILAFEGACIVFAPDVSEEYYTFFAPDLRLHLCESNLAHTPRRIALAISPYDEQSGVSVQATLSRLSYVKSYVASVATPKIVVFRR